MAALVDNKTPRLDLPLPDRQNFLQDDVERLIETIKDLDGEVALVAADGKLEPAQLPDNAAKVDASGILLESQLPVKVVTVDNQGKIPMTRIPAGALTNNHEASNDTQMLALPALVGDLCQRLDTGATYMLTKMPGNVRDNWREVPPSAVYSINGKTGAITGIAASGENTDITKLSGLKGPLSLPADGVNPYDAVTVRQLASVTAGQGATMNGVMNNFIGAVEWFNGDRLHIPVGYIAADGQVVSRTDPATAELWTAVNSGMLNKVTEALWIDSGDAYRPTAWRSSYSDGNGTTHFRVPDLNGIGANSIKHLFLSGSSGSPSEPSAGQVWSQSAPNITGQISSIASDYTIGTFIRGSGAFNVPGTNENRIINPQVQGGSASANAQFDANRVNHTYGRGSQYQLSNGGAAVAGNVDNIGDLYPNHAVGIWIIRASGSFRAADTSFEVLNQDAATPPMGTTVKGGMLQSTYKLAGETVNAAGLLVSNTIGGTPSATVGVANYNSQTKGLDWKSWNFEWDGGLRFPTSGFIRTTGGYFTIDAATRCQDLHTNPGGGCGVRTGLEPNGIELNNLSDQFPLYGWVNWLKMDWYGGYGQIGVVRGQSRDIQNIQVTLAQDPSAGIANKDWSFKANGEFTGPLGLIGPPVSDATLKHAIGRSKPGALDRINRIHTHEFTWNHTDRRERGWLAQELRDVDPLYVIECDNGVLNTPYNCIIADLIDAVKTLTARNAELEARLAKLEA
ncbi:hypothetical protein GJ904_23070 [Salmonella enterica]|nr:tail fiber domain-containing protein [Salmonella enterica subsp. enterica serovar Saintpaul]EEC1303943.1 hypothetical protein [Salmonella enterica]